jgi:carboxylesterase
MKKRPRNYAYVIVGVVIALILAGWLTPDPMYDALPTEGNGQYLFEASSETAVLVVHGLSATPWEVFGLSVFLSEHNVTVYTPVLAGHGRRPVDLEATTWEDWYVSVEEGYNRLSANYSHVFVVGVSTGGSLALELAKHHAVAGVVTVGAPVNLRDSRVQYADKLAPFWRYTSRKVLPEEQGHYYPIMPSKSVVELNKMIAAVQTDLKDVREPILIVQSERDGTVDPSSAQILFDRVGSTDKKVLWLEKTSHTVVRDDSQGTALSAIEEFVVTH